MRTLYAGPLTAVGGFHKKAAKFRPSPEEKLFGTGIGFRIAPTAESRVRLATLLGLFAAERISWVRMKQSWAGVMQSPMPVINFPGFGFTSSGELRVIV